MGKNVNGKESVATMWARMVADAVAGEVIGITDKHGEDVAVMLSLENFQAMQAEITELREEVLGWRAE